MAIAQLLIIHEKIMRKRYDEWLCLLRINNLVHLVARMIYWVSTFDLSIWFVFSLFFLFLMCFFLFFPLPPTCFFSLYILPPLLHTLKCGQGCVGPQQRASKVSLYIMQTIHFRWVSTLSRYFHLVHPGLEFVPFNCLFLRFIFPNVQDFNNN